MQAFFNKESQIFEGFLFVLKNKTSLKRKAFRKLFTWKKHKIFKFKTVLN